MPGENGAGKSTFIKMLSGAVKPDEGEIRINGEVVDFHSPIDARRAGVATAYQELTHVATLTVGQNLLLGHEPTNALGFSSNSAVHAAAAQMLREWELEDVDPEAITGGIPLGVQQQLELVRAFSRDAPLLLLDEPTAALGASQVEWLFRQIARVKAEGKTIIFISHRMGEVRDICDAATVLRGGVNAGSLVPSEAGDDEVLKLMLGRELEELEELESKESNEPGPVSVAVDELVVPPALRGVSFELRRGEVVGLAALQGHGQRELFMALFGAARASAGTISIDGKPAKLRSPRDAIRSEAIALVPEDRKTEGVFLNMSCEQNIAVTALHRVTRFGLIRRDKERTWAKKVFSLVNVRESAMEANVADLSGGNQQKIAIGKWLTIGARTFLMFDPTRGVDVGTKTEIFALMHQVANDGGTVFFHSTDIEELLRVCGRVLVLYKGQIVADLQGEALTKSRLLGAVVGESPQPSDRAEVVM